MMGFVGDVQYLGFKEIKSDKIDVEIDDGGDDDGKQIFTYFIAH